MDKILTLQNIDKVYGTKVKTQVLFDINLSFEPGSFNSIIGESGSGKSTLLNIIGTLDKPTSGKVLINNVDTVSLNNKELAKLRNETLGFVFQFHYLLPEFTTLENVLIPYLIKNKKPDKEILRRAEELIEIVGLEKVKNNLSTDMSGGQQQRAAIARALINRPKVILADEPTGNLDSETTDKIYNLLKEINQEFQSTFIVITHDKKVAERTDRIVELKDGRVHLDLLKNQNKT
ncbi:ABC transporter ATP-binding protein [Dethiobacter alkaliphilus]|uniref:ABC transporter related protein n=1 Tax=Dethiobacter alkaliphilus AHT 1 TaxID=555088 RepID=C0GCI6_DETAL|nr:ABC transporter ATP-binding protein [Dethiobacter alkaliphilus]EEG78921.1 ABC transporter related protein [Dethiobacter alkaliphilus AHT 1]